MTRAVHKYYLRIKDGIQSVPMPRDARIVHVDKQDEFICMWAEVDLADGNHNREFEVFGTGHPIKDASMVWRGTVLGTGHRGTVLDGFFVWHVYESGIWPNVR